MLDCPCGHKMSRICVGYGRTPYSIFCEGCKTNFFNKITNTNVDGAVQAWNEYVTVNRFGIRPDKEPRWDLDSDGFRRDCHCKDCVKD